MDRGRRAEPYSNASTWTREVARNLASHLTRVSKAHSCIDTKSPISTRLPQCHLSYDQKKCSTNFMNKLQPLIKVTRTLHQIDDDEPGITEEDCVRGEIKKKISVKHLEKDLRCKELVHKRNVGNLYPVQNDRIHDLKQDSSELLPNKVSGNAYTSDNTTYELVPSRPHHFKHDYYKRQELRRIRQENQALIKRLQSTKTTLNTKEWEKDDKRTQEFLKVHEKRREVLQNELRRAQRSPEAVLRSKPLKSRYPRHKKKNAFDSSSHLSEVDAFGGLNVKEKTRRKTRSRVKGAFQHVNTETDRRTTSLRDQKPSSIELKETAGDAANSFTSVAHSTPLSNNDNVTMQIAGLRRQSPSPSPSSLEQSKQPAVLKAEFDRRDMVGISSAFSPGAELESVLSAAEVSDSDLRRGPPRTAVTIDIGDRSAWGRSEACIPNLLDGAPALFGEAQADKVAASEPVVETRKEILEASLEATQMLQDDQDKETSYDGDAFDDDRQQNNDKGSGGTSKLEVQDDEAHGRGVDVGSTEYTSELCVGKLEESTDDEEYSHDDFE